MQRDPRRKRSSASRMGEAVDGCARLRSIYDEVDALLAGWSCDASTECCRFGITGREPYPTAIELAEIERAVRARGGLPKRRSLPTVSAQDELDRPCALLSDGGKCLVYAARPFGCRTFFCERARGPAGESGRAAPKDDIARLGRAIADLSARFATADPGPRPLSNATAAWGSGSRTLARRRR